MYPHIYAHACKRENPVVVAFTCHPINKEIGGEDRQMPEAIHPSQVDDASGPQKILSLIKDGHSLKTNFLGCPLVSECTQTHMQMHTSHLRTQADTACVYTQKSISNDYTKGRLERTGVWGQTGGTLQRHK